MDGHDIPQPQASTPALPFLVTEAYKTLRTNLMFALSSAENKAIIISSALPSEGKSVTSANLARTMAQTESKVVLVDADLRYATQYQHFRCANVKGLSTVLGGFDTIQEVVMRDVHPNLDIITSGPTPPNPSELLGSDRMDEIIAQLNNYYDYVFIDTPPINLVSDALLLSKKVAGVVLITRQEKSRYNELTKAVSKLEFSGANILGLVVNAVSEKAGKYGKYEYSKYAKGRGNRR